MSAPGPRERARARREAEELRDERDNEDSDDSSSTSDSDSGSSGDGSYSQDGRQSNPNYTNPDSGGSEDSGSDSSGSSGDDSYSQDGRQSNPNYTNPDASDGGDGGGSSSSSGAANETDLSGGDPDTGLTENELDRMDARVVGDTATNPTEDQLANLRGVARNRAGSDSDIYIARTPSGAAVAYAGSQAEEAASTSTRRTVAQQFEQQAEQDTGQDIAPGRDFTVQETDQGFQASFTDSYRRRRAEEELERQLEEDTGEDLVPGEDFTVEETEDGFQAVFSDEYAQEQEQQQAEPQSTFVPDARARSQIGGDQGVRVAPLSEEEATEDLEQQLEQQFGRDLTPGEDFTVEETDQGYRAEPTQQLERELFREQLMEREDVDSTDDFEISEEDGELQARIEPDRREEDFVEGVFSAVDDVISPAVTSFEAQSGVDIPGEGAAVTTSDTGSPDQISGGARDAAGVENTTSVAEVSDDVFGQADDDVRQEQQNVNQAATGEGSPYNVVDNVVEFLDADNEPLPYMEEELTDEGLERVQGVQGSAPSGAAAVGPGGAARGAAGASRVASSSDDVLKALGVTGAAAGVGVASQEVDVPEGRDRSELEVAESTPGAEVSVPEDTSQSEIAIPEDQGTRGEVGVGESVTSSEVTVPEENADVDVFSASPVAQGEVGQQQEQEEEDDELGVPDDVWRESDRRLYDPQREFGEQEDISRSVDPTRDENPSEQDIGGGIAGTGSGYDPARGQTVEENFNQWMEEQRQLEEEAQRQQVLERDELVGSEEASSELSAEQEASNDMVRQAEEQQVTAEETSLGQWNDEWLTPFEDTGQDAGSQADQMFDERFDQPQQFDQRAGQTPGSDMTVDEVLENVTEPDAASMTFDGSNEFGNPNRTWNEYNFPGTPEGYGRPGTPSRIPLPEFDDTDTADIGSEDGVIDKVFDTGVVQSLEELEDDDDESWF